MAKDWTKLQKKYRGMWVALGEDEQTVLSSGKTAKEAWTKARKMGYEKPIMTHMPEKIATYVGFGLGYEI